MSPLNLSPGALSIACASVTASAGDVTPQRRAPVSHSTSTRQAFDRFLRVRDDLDVRAAGESHEAVELGLTDKVVGQQDVGDSRVNHDLRLAELLTIDAFRAKFDLQVGEFGDLVGLDVRAKAQAMTVEIGLTPS